MGHRWTNGDYEAMRAKVKDELDVLAQGDSTARQHLVMNQIESLVQTSGEANQLKLFVLCIHALLNQERWRCYSKSTVNMVTDLGYAILRRQGIDPQKSRLAHLYGALHSVQSQLERNMREHWQAAWEQLTAASCFQKASGEEQTFQQMVLANRLLRSGMLHASLASYEAALAEDLPSEVGHKAAVGKATVLRLLNDSGAYRSWIDEASARFRGLESLAEWQFEALRWSTITKQDPREMLRSVRKGQPHYHISFLIETSLWCLSLPNDKWVARAPSMKSLQKNSALKPASQGAYFACALALQAMYEDDIPLYTRLTQLGRVLRRSGEIRNLDRELLVWYAAESALTRLGDISFAAYVSHRIDQLLIDKKRAAPAKQACVKISMAS